ncbi:flagellar motor protein MotB [Paenibacillus cisolokensis]|uniref:flagellar motor protein MotB n=1 Tax=Paenibacillus TaxID=44249 RepID=UPI000721A954|nr:flagellar motor protein MotB [Paenibacillus sp. 32O-W]ALS25695.1 flagellar motor protein MotB [Paenibacillus sp. 32O-W]
MNKKRKHDDHEEHPNESWLIPYADLMTLLLALFIVLYSMSSIDAKKFEEMSRAFNLALPSGNGVLDHYRSVEPRNDLNDMEQKKETDKEKQREALMKKEQEDLEKLKRQIDKYIKENGLTTLLETKLNQSQLMITISDNALFASGSAQLKPESRELAVAISNMLQSYPEYEVVVSGHTDNEPISNERFASNWDLSSARAIRFMDVLLQNRNLNPERFSAIGYGEYRPVASNATAEGRALNRRVEVSIIRKYVDPELTQPITAAQQR